jgi:ribosomal protein S18 acetylase RimI-like enzyme
VALCSRQERRPRLPPITDRSTIRALLEIDRPWSVYALGDLSPARFAHCQWWCAAGGAPALALLYRAFSPPVLLTVGQPDLLQAVVGEIPEEPQMYLHVRPEVMGLLEGRYRVRGRMDMWRMILDLAKLPVVATAGVARLGAGDLEALTRLYADGEATGESPDFFSPGMLAEGVYFGMREGSELVAAAGTHLVAEEESVAAIGNVYTRRDRRGRGLATHLVAATAAELLRRGLRTVALNVAQTNRPAIRVYERLGFAHYCDFVEGLASLSSPAGERGV